MRTRGELFTYQRNLPGDPICRFFMRMQKSSQILTLLFLTSLSLFANRSENLETNFRRSEQELLFFIRIYNLLFSFCSL